MVWGKGPNSQRNMEGTNRGVASSLQTDHKATATKMCVLVKEQQIPSVGQNTEPKKQIT